MSLPLPAQPYSSPPPLPPVEDSPSAPNPSAPPDSAPPSTAEGELAVAGGAITRLQISAASTRQERLAWLMWQNRELVNWYIGAAIQQMPPLLRGLIRVAGKQLGVSVETQFGPALVAFIYQMPSDQFRAMWIELGTMFRWAGEGKE